jgi:hypothetical protein
MDTIVGLEELLVSLGSGLVFLVPEGRRVVIPDGLNARGAKPKALNASIQRTRPKVEAQGLNTMLKRQQNSGR